MEITNNTAAGIYTNNYKNKNMSGQDYENTMKRKTSETEVKENKILGIGFLHDKNSPISYGMCMIIGNQINTTVTTCLSGFYRESYVFYQIFT